MGQSMKKLAGDDEKKAKDFGPIIDNYYNKHFSGPKKDCKADDFHQAACEIVEEINKKLGNTQFRIPKTEILKKAYEAHHHSAEGPLTKEEFQSILQDVARESTITGAGAKDVLLYIFGVPMVTLFFKQRAIPRAIPNEIFIPAVTSATVYVLAKLNKI